MKYFKDVNNRIYAYAADGSQDAYIKHGLIQITDAELSELNKPTMSAAKAEKLNELQQARDKAAAANVTVQGKVFSAETKIVDLFAKLADRVRRGKASKLAAILTVDGTPVQATQQLLEQIEDAIADQMEIAWNKYGTLVAQVNAATTAAQVNAVVW